METGLTPSLKYYLASLLAIIGWGLSTSFVEFGLDYIDPYQFLALRFLLAVVLASPFILVTKRKEVQQLQVYYFNTWVSYRNLMCQLVWLLF